MTIDLDDNLYTALKIESAKKRKTAKDIISDALINWLQTQEDIELKEEIKQIRSEWRENGGVEAGEFFKGIDSNNK